MFENLSNVLIDLNFLSVLPNATSSLDVLSVHPSGSTNESSGWWRQDCSVCVCVYIWDLLFRASVEERDVKLRC